MQVNTKFFPEVMTDNEAAYFQHLQAIIESVDELAAMEITKNPNSYHFRIATSIPKYNEMVLQEVLRYHNLLQIKLSLSKSIKSSATINFSITLNN